MARGGSLPNAKFRCQASAAEPAKGVSTDAVARVARPAFSRRDAKPGAKRTGKVRRAVESTFESDLADGEVGLRRIFKSPFAGRQLARP